MSIFNFLTEIIKPVTDLVDNVTTTEEERLEAQAKLAAISKDVEIKMLEYSTTLAEQRAKIILAEAQGSWLQRNWRPILMLAVIAIIVNNYILFPYLSMITSKVKVLELPGGLWALLTTGVGGYVAGRSLEKGISTWKNGE